MSIVKALGCQISFMMGVGSLNDRESIDLGVMTSIQESVPSVGSYRRKNMGACQEVQIWALACSYLIRLQIDRTCTKHKE